MGFNIFKQIANARLIHIAGEMKQNLLFFIIFILIIAGLFNKSIAKAEKCDEKNIMKVSEESTGNTGNTGNTGTLDDFWQDDEMGGVEAPVEGDIIDKKTSEYEIPEKIEVLPITASEDERYIINFDADNSFLVSPFDSIPSYVSPGMGLEIDTTLEAVKVEAVFVRKNEVITYPVKVTKKYVLIWKDLNEKEVRELVERETLIMVERACTYTEINKLNVYVLDELCFSGNCFQDNYQYDKVDFVCPFIKCQRGDNLQKPVNSEGIELPMEYIVSDNYLKPELPPFEAFENLAFNTAHTSLGEIFCKNDEFVIEDKEILTSQWMEKETDKGLFEFEKITNISQTVKIKCKFNILNIANGYYQMAVWGRYKLFFTIDGFKEDCSHYAQITRDELSDERAISENFIDVKSSDTDYITVSLYNKSEEERPAEERPAEERTASADKCTMPDIFDIFVFERAISSFKFEKLKEINDKNVYSLSLTGRYTNESDNDNLIYELSADCDLMLPYDDKAIYIPYGSILYFKCFLGNGLESINYKIEIKDEIVIFEDFLTIIIPQSVMPGEHVINIRCYAGNCISYIEAKQKIYSDIKDEYLEDEKISEKIDEILVGRDDNLWSTDSSGKYLNYEKAVVESNNHFFVEDDNKNLMLYLKPVNDNSFSFIMTGGDFRYQFLLCKPFFYTYNDEDELVYLDAYYKRTIDKGLYRTVKIGEYYEDIFEKELKAYNYSFKRSYNQLMKNADYLGENIWNIRNEVGEIYNPSGIILNRYMFDFDDEILKDEQNDEQKELLVTGNAKAPFLFTPHTFINEICESTKKIERRLECSKVRVNGCYSVPLNTFFVIKGTNIFDVFNGNDDNLGKNMIEKEKVYVGFEIERFIKGM